MHAEAYVELIGVGEVRDQDLIVESAEQESVTLLQSRDGFDDPQRSHDGSTLHG
jgi:hypothetical protein